MIGWNDKHFLFKRGRQYQHLTCTQFCDINILSAGDYNFCYCESIPRDKIDSVNN